MDYDWRSTSTQPTLITRTSLAARQWETCLLTEAALPEQRASLSLPLVGYRRWLEQLWTRGRDADTRPLLLSRGQSLALWRRVIDDSPQRSKLINSAAPAQWAADAWQRLQTFGIDAAQLRAGGHEPDFDAFLQWCRAYRRSLADGGWIDVEGAADRLAARSPDEATGSLCLLDFYDSTPLQQRLFASFSNAGWQLTERRPDAVDNRSVRLRLADRDEELCAAIEWAKQRWMEAPAQPVAIVVEDLRNRGAEVSRALDRTFDEAGGCPFWTEHGQALDSQPSIAAALTGIELLSPQSDFTTFSRWLRSPFFHGFDPAAASLAAAIETGLRVTLLPQLRFSTAFRQAGLAGRLRRLAPALADGLEAAMDRVGPPQRSRTPTDWAARWGQGLRQLGWPAIVPSADQSWLRDWEHALESFAQLSPIVGTLSLPAAIAQLRHGLRQSRWTRPLPRTGVHVYGDIDAIGPAYRSVWVTGLSDRNWPAPARINPLLPRELQLRHRMPGAAPDDALARCRQALLRLRARVGDVVISWPGKLQEQDAAPSALIEGLRETDLDELRLSARIARPSHRFDPQRIERLEDRPPPLAGARIEGGAGTLSRQARCPLRAFCETRLDAHPLEPVTAGLSPRIQGIVTHRALELLAARLPTRERLCSAEPAALRAQVAEAVATALNESFGRARKPLARLFDLELDRLAALLSALLDKEKTRAPFSIAASEKRVEIGLGAWTIPCRIDRIDRFSDGALAVLDYKTGRSASAQDWFRPRLRDTQLPLYALQAADELVAVVVVSLRRGTVAYKGVWPQRGQFPGRAAVLPEGRDWPTQLQVWRRQIQQLIDEYAAGDARVFDTELDDAKGPYAPLSRIYEQLADRQERRPHA